MKIHEYQAKAILAQYNVPVPRGEVAYTADEAEAAAKKLGGSVVVKSQIHAGGRGKGGGVKVAKNAEEAVEIARKMIGMTLVTHQTGPEGRVVQRLLIEETLPIERELYLGIVLDRVQGKPVFMASSAGGMDIRSCRQDAGTDFERDDRSRHGADAIPGTQAGIRDRDSGGQRTGSGGRDDGAHQGVSSDGHVAGGDQSVHPDERR